MHSSFFTSTLCQREAGGFYTVARLEMDRAEISKYNIFAYQKHLHAAATYQAEASNRSARARRLMGME
jgi:hypothetical protein